MRRSMGVVLGSKVPTQDVLQLCPRCAAYVLYDVLAVRKPVRRSGRLSRFLGVQTEGFVMGYFSTPVWCTGANLQRLVGCLWHRWLPRLNCCRKLLVLSDRGLVALDWLNQERLGAVMLLASGGYTDHQCRPWCTLLSALAAVGFPGLVANGRGWGGVPLTTNRISYAASVSDFAEVVSNARKRYQRECLLAAGMSMGGLLLFLYMYQRGHNLSNPWGFNVLSNACIPRGLVGSLRDNEEMVRVVKVTRPDDLIRCWTLASFDQHYAAPAFGFQFVQDFYENCSWKGWLCMVRRPVVFLVSADTPETPRVPCLKTKCSPWLAAVVTTRAEATWISWTVKQ
ncbi:hypothetical protein V5799_023640 [Amblyomma americanum]|uniref:Serine aminopeptidase S33 domain-containing protein n=1 Tax=Amblyomma americanum TaxID=6943 RepID=A0AAQ4FIQ1_AMBAM